MKLIRKPQPGERKISWWWPTIDSVFAAKTVAHRGAGVAAFQAALFAVFTTLAVLNIWNPAHLDGYAYADGALYAICAYFMYYKHSRVAALVALGDYIAGTIINWTPHENNVGFITIVFLLAYVHALRAGFVFNRLRKSELAELTVYAN